MDVVYGLLSEADEGWNGKSEEKNVFQYGDGCSIPRE